MVVAGRHGTEVLDALLETRSGITYNLTTGQRGNTGEGRVFTWLFRFHGEAAVGADQQPDTGLSCLIEE